MNLRITEREALEVYEVIKKADIFKNKLPKDVIEFFENKVKKCRYVFEYNQKEDIFKQISKDSLALVTYLYLKYICDDEEKKLELKDILIKNEIKKREVYE